MMCREFEGTEWNCLKEAVMGVVEGGGTAA